MSARQDVIEGLRNGVVVGAAVLAVGYALVQLGVLPTPWSSAQPAVAAWHADTAGPGAAPPPAGAAAAPQRPGMGAPPPARRLELGDESASLAVRRLAQWVLDANDHGDRHFVVLDKRNARVFVFEPDGRLAGASPVLLGYAAGDDTVPGIGDRPIEQVKPQERTTPAGRFVAERGRNALNEDVVWVDYDAAVSMHRVRATNPKERRLQRLASATSSDNRISYGCINLPVAFFDEVVWPRFRSQRGLVYVLPEVKPLTDVFPGLASATAATTASLAGKHASVAAM
ncbi:hypothetical protein [Ideonella sp.]|uniref:hypothetical protein n=1 Tax=Ideonella sp. TaxID=1929293 RepID=UPI0035AE8344